MYEKLRGRMREKKVSQSSLASHLGITLHSYNAKINGRTQFTIFEATRIADYLDLSNPCEYFFENNFPNMQRS